MADSVDAPLPIQPDDKDWTWVLDRPCPECGFDSATVDIERVGEMLRSNSDEWHELLTARSDVADRPRPDHWSILEYGCHVRDVCRLYLERLELMLTRDGPEFENWDQDRTAVETRYDLASPELVASELVGAAEALAARFDRIEPAERTRTGYRSDGASFTVDSFARYFIHDPIHHLHDVR